MKSNLFKKIVCAVIFGCVLFTMVACSSGKKTADSEAVNQKDSDIVLDYNAEKGLRERVGDVYHYYTRVTGSIKNNRKQPIYNVYVYYEIEQSTGELVYGETKVVGINGLQPGEQKPIQFRIETSSNEKTVVRVVLSDYTE